MLSILSSAGQSILATSVRLSAPRYATFALQASNKPSLAHGIVNSIAQRPNINIVQPLRQFSKTNNTAARFGTRERAVPIKTTLDHVNSMHTYGMLALGGAGAFGIGAICYYGLGMSNEEGIIDRSVLWPRYVKERITSTYVYLAGGLGISTAAAFATLQSPAMMRFFSSGSIMFAIGSMAALIASSTLVHNIPYESGLGAKQLAYAGHCSLLGMIIAPLSVLGGPAIIRAAVYTAGIVGGLSTIAICAPSERFLVTAAPLSIGLGAVVASSIGSLFLSPTSRIGLGLYGISLYGGLLVFSGLLLMQTQRTIKVAEVHPAYSRVPYDPINNSLGMYMSIINIFIRTLMIFGGGQKRK